MRRGEVTWSQIPGAAAGSGCGPALCTLGPWACTRPSEPPRRDWGNAPAADANSMVARWHLWHMDPTRLDGDFQASGGMVGAP